MMALVEYFREPDVHNRCCVVIFVGAVKMLQISICVGSKSKVKVRGDYISECDCSYLIC